jgi:hypothetical protein
MGQGLRRFEMAIDSQSRFLDFNIGKQFQPARPSLPVS